MERKTKASNDHKFFDRDLSWLTFNERILLEAARSAVPLLERVNFLSIFSSNLDEFYRVRMPALAALNQLHRKEKGGKKLSLKHGDVLQAAKDEINRQQELFGKLLREVTSSLERYQITFLYDRPLPPEIFSQARHFFFTQVLGFLKPLYLQKYVLFSHFIQQCPIVRQTEADRVGFHVPQLWKLDDIRIQVFQVMVPPSCYSNIAGQSKPFEN